jgi:MurNAc alpha-1-phosphate uridylyltransferase
MTLPVAILAGGLATRLGAVAQATPKVLVEVAGKPFAVHQIELLARHGVSDIVFCTGHLGEAVEAALGDGSRWGVRVRYVNDGAVRRGTGGALRHALPQLGESFLVLYGDSYLDCDYEAIASAFLAGGLAGLMTVCRNDDQWDRSNVAFEGGRILRYDKQRRSEDMRYIDYGLGALRAEALERFPAEAPFDLVEVYQSLISRHQLTGFEVTGRFYEIGSPTGLEETRRYLQAKTGTSR